MLLHGIEVKQRPKLKTIIRFHQEQERGKSNKGFCINCGKWSNGCETDAVAYPCPHCKQDAVMGIFTLTAF